ncbi:YbaB/EbfC family nucleoid-associated protein [Helicobacter fennelliae]|uniref:Nucleoid-associated protein HFN_1325 n=2 Tax=Helicobacter fennelliae TaxID=215 RepID=T1D4F0_9HELI|nr:YbaB/EbfC family nucleoid-associated protein [Helicobacter fennelliae]GAD20081.1 transcriptional regulatory protein [Helicobacter fennelliae MRY12-0050]SQB98254.1 transcriptional regulatory protein [Helicobacter fennelliae]STQ84525.1 transcriptional regulatory protein [Helicobacter fennelliae]
MFDMNNLAAMFGDMQKNVKELEEKSKNVVLSAKSGGGMVSVSMNGAGEVVDLHIDDSLLEDKESLQILLISAFNDVYKGVEENKKSMALGMLGGMNMFGKN